MIPKLQNEIAAADADADRDAAAAAATATATIATAAAALIEHASRWQPGSPWAQPSGWRAGVHRPARYWVPEPVEVLGPPDAAEVNGIPTRFSHDTETATIELDGVATTFRWARGDGVLWLHGAGRTHEFRTPTREQQLAEHRATLSRVEGAVSPDIRSAMPGTVVAVTAATGDVVEAGQPLLTIEAMKMEHTMLASVAGTVTITVGPGDLVRLDQVVATIHPHEGAAA